MSCRERERVSLWVDGVLNVADALIGKLNKTDIRGHSACSFREVFLKRYCTFASAQKIRSNRGRVSAFNIRTAEKSAKVTSRREIAPGYEDREQDRSRAHSGRVSR